MNIVASVVVPLISIAVGAGVTYWLNVRTRRSIRFEDLINAAIAAVAVEEASRTAITRVVATPDQLDEKNLLDLQIAVTKAAIENHNAKNMEAREAIARVMIIDQSVRGYYLDTNSVSERSEQIIEHLTRLRDSRRGRRS